MESAGEAATEPEAKTGPEPGREAGLEPGPEGGSEDAREKAPEGPDAPPFVREGGSEPAREAPLEGPPDRPFSSEAGLEGGPEVPSEAGSACPGATAAKTLAELGGAPLPSALAVQDDRIFVGVSSGGTTDQDLTGAIVAISVATGDKTTFSLGPNLPNQIVAVPSDVFYIPGKATAITDGWSFEYTEVARLDPTTGQVSIVDTAAVASTVSVVSLAVAFDGMVFWSRLRDLSGGGELRVWNDRSRSAGTLNFNPQPVSLLGDANGLNWSELDSDLHATFMQLSQYSLVAVPLYRSPEVFPDVPSLAAVNERSLYYVAAESMGRGIFAMSTRGLESRTISAGANPLILDNQTIDETHVYWVDQADQSSIRRAPKTGEGSTETVWSGASGITDLVVAGCNVYWTIGAPSRLMVMGK